MTIGQFRWRGYNIPTQGYPLINAVWPVGRYGAAMSSSKNLLWLFGGTGLIPYNDLSTFSDGTIYYVLCGIVL